MKKLKILLSCLLSLFVIFSVIPLSSQAHAYNFENSQYLTINPHFLFSATKTVSNVVYQKYCVAEIRYSHYILQFYSYEDNILYAYYENSYVFSSYVGASNLPVYMAVLDTSTDTWVVEFAQADINTVSIYLPGSTLRNGANNSLISNRYYFSFFVTQTVYQNSTYYCNMVGNVNQPSNSFIYREYVPDIITAAVILGVQNSGGSGSGSGSVDTTNIINAIIQARESIIDTVEDGDDYTQSMLTFLAEVLYGDLSGNNNDPTVQDILDSGAINILDYYFKDYFNQLYYRYKNENNQIVNAIWQALNTGNAVNASDNVSAINALKAAIRDEIANSGQLSYIEYVSYIVDYLDVFYMALYNQNTEILEKVDRLLTISSSNTATITNRIQQSEDNIINGINDAGENTGSPDLSHTGLDSALSQGSGWASQILSASAVIDQATQNVAYYLDSGSSILNSILTSFPIFGVILSFVLVFFLVRKVIGR